jgi:glycosyltransferase involved in cell wall biosynthesis
MNQTVLAGRRQKVAARDDTKSLRGAPGRLSVLVGVADDHIGGIGTYADCVAAAASLGDHDVTLVVTTAALREKLGQRLRGTGVQIVDLGLPALTDSRFRWRRLLPGAIVRYLSGGLSRCLPELGRRFSVAHLNVPALAPVVRPFAQRVLVAAWFYPHGLKARLATWQYTRGNPSSSLPRRLAIMAKSLSLYMSDVRGYRASDLVVAPTEMLAAQLRSMGIASVVCHAPVWLPSGESEGVVNNTSRPRVTRRKGCDLRMVTCAVDLSHPRKNVRDSVEALGFLAGAGRSVTLDAIGGRFDSLSSVVAGLPAGATVTEIGHLSREQVHARFREADLFVTSSLYEEWGYAAVEALLCGTPVVAYPVYPFPQLLRDGLGVVAQEVSARSLAQAIERAANGGVRPDLAQAAAERFGVPAVGRQLARIWKESLQADRVEA